MRVPRACPLFAEVPRGPLMNGGIMSPPANQRPPGLQFVGIEQHLNAEVPADLEFKDELGNPVKLADYFGHGRPVILNLGYYQCPMLCSELLQGLVGSMKALTFNLGKDFDVVTVSFDPRETTEMAAAKKRDIMKRYGRPNFRSRLALSHRQSRSDQRAHQCRRLPISVRSEDRAVRARRRHRHAHARPPRLGIFLRRRVFSQRSAPRGWCRPRRTRLATSAIRFCSTAITTIPGPENTAPSSAIF
jgi:hypothetical protein